MQDASGICFTERRHMGSWPLPRVYFADGRQGLLGHAVCHCREDKELTDADYVLAPRCSIILRSNPSSHGFPLGPAYYRPASRTLAWAAVWAAWVGGSDTGAQRGVLGLPRLPARGLPVGHSLVGCGRLCCPTWPLLALAPLCARVTTYIE